MMTAWYREYMKNWEPVDDSSLSANQVQWSKASVTLEQLVEDYELPQIIRVTQGWCGEEESSPDTLQGDEIVLFHEYITQSRVVAVDKYGQHITIAKDINYKFEVFDDERIGKVGPAGPYAIPELLERYEYPVKVRLAKRNGSHITIKQVFEYRDIRDFGDVTFTMSHSVNFLIGHCLSGRDLNSYNAIAVLPMPIDVDCEVGTIIVDGKKREWARFVHKLSKVARASFDFDKFINANNDAYLLKAGQVPEDENEYDSIKPKFIHGGSSSECQNTKIDTDYEDYRTFMERRDSMKSLKGVQKPYSYVTHDAAPNKLHPETAADREAALRLIKGRETLYGVRQPEPEENTEPPPPVPARKPLNPGAAKPSKPAPSGLPKDKSKFVFPKTLDRLSINGVCQCLEALGFEDYCPRFREEQIDGAMLSCMTSEMFVRDMGMTNFQAMKMHKFIHVGWRPNYGN